MRSGGVGGVMGPGTVQRQKKPRPEVTGKDAALRRRSRTLLASGETERRAGRGSRSGYSRHMGQSIMGGGGQHSRYERKKNAAPWGRRARLDLHRLGGRARRATTSVIPAAVDAILKGCSRGGSLCFLWIEFHHPVGCAVNLRPGWPEPLWQGCFSAGKTHDRATAKQGCWA
jgi:hypothetical protein